MNSNILINVYYPFGGGGIESMITNLSVEARDSGIKSCLIIIGVELGKVNETNFDKVTLIKDGLTGKQLAQALQFQCQIIEHEQQGKAKILIHTPGLWAYFFRLSNVECVIHSIPTLITSQRGIKAKIRKWMMARVYQKHKMVAVSEGVAFDLIQKFHLKKQNVRVVYNGVNTHRLEDLAKQTADLPNQKYIVSVARLNPVKQHSHLIQAISMLKDKPQVLIMGSGDSNYLQGLQQQVNELELQSYIKFTGHINNPYPYIKNADLLVLCSKTEALPMVIIESIILGTPVVSYCSPTGPIEILEEKNPDSLVELNNTQQLSKRIEQQLQHSSNIDKDYYQQRFSITTTLKKIMEPVN